MSASLVGSEMCIRDSPIRRQSAIRAQSVICSPRSEAEKSFKFHPRRPRPVSYTHLTLPTICSV
eukprot:3928589-Alexandrium_andersonii.AAC.1